MKEEANNKENPGIEVSLIDEVTGDNIKDITVDVLETSLDHFLEEDVIKEIPVFGTLYKAGKVVSGIRESIFAKKILKFLFEINKIPQEERIRFINKLEAEKKFRNKVGEKLIVIIEQLDDLDKPEIIGRLFKAAIKEQITYDDFLRLSSVVQKAYVPDLINLRDGRSELLPNEQFSSLGIFNWKLEKDPGAITSVPNTMGSIKFEPALPLIEYNINELGQKLINYGLV